MSYRWFVVLLCFVITGCASAYSSEQIQPPIPTLFPTATPQFGDPYESERIATEFLHSWQAKDYPAMYNLISFASQQATDYTTFQALYENAAQTLRLDNFGFAILAQSQTSFRVTEFLYDVTFQSNILGTFTDPQRSLTLVMDDMAADWRVAWSPGNIFTEMGSGALLRFRSFPPRRANIYDSEGNILADMNGTIVAVNLIRGRIPALESCIAMLADALNATEDEIRLRLNNFKPEQLAEIAQIEVSVYEQWSSELESVCGVTFESRPARRYINGDLAPHVIGYVGYPDETDLPAIEAAGFQQDSIIGKAGVEQAWDETLRGVPGGELSLVTPDGETIRILTTSSPIPPQSVYLTINSDLQRYALRAIADAYANGAWAGGSDGASLVAMDVNTGAILAMVSYPTFDANAFMPFPVMGREAAQEIVRSAEEDPRQPLLNRVSQGSYPTGSTMKMITATAALDSGVYRLDEEYVSVGVWNRDIPRVDWLSGGHGSVTLSEALTVSCNTCFYEAGYRMNEIDPYIFSDYATRLGLGLPTGIGEVPEDPGLIGNPDNKVLYEDNGVPWNFSDSVNIAIGQGGVKVSPLQLVRAYATVANGGVLYRPQLVAKTSLLDDITYTMTPDPMSYTDIRIDVMESIRTGLCDVTTKSYGTAEYVFRRSRLQEIGVCGKTGTATSAGTDSLPHAWFVGYAPRENPQIIVLAMLENAGEGSGVAAPIVCRVLEHYFYDTDLDTTGCY